MNLQRFGVLGFPISRMHVVFMGERVGVVDEAKKDYQQAQDRKIYQPAIGKLTVTLE